MRRFESKHQPLLPGRQFAWRLARNVLTAAAIVAFSLTIGAIGYRATAQLPWVDAFYDATMILTGMGPAATPPTSEAKIFASLYALFSGVVFLTTVALVVTPIAHRFLHRFHVE